MKTLSRAAAFLAVAGILPALIVSAGERIDINNAPLEELTKIIHIGEARAKELISLRPFSSIDDLARVKGLGDSRIADIKNQGLAWVDNSCREEPKSAEPEPLLAAANEQTSQKSSAPLLIAVLLAVFSAIAILILKKKSKIV